MKVSIITVCLNSEDTIERTINSVIRQTYEDIEYIIVDGKSTDKTLSIINRYKDKVSKIVSEHDNGIYDAMNKGIQLSSGEIIGILNSDDWYETDAIHAIVDLFENTESEIIHGDIRLIYPDGTSKDTQMDDLNKLWYEMAVRHPATFVKREVYERIGLFDCSYRIAADYEFILRCYSSSIRFFYINKILTNFSLTGISSTNHKLCGKETRAIALKYADKAPDPHEVKKIVWERERDNKLSELLTDQPQAIIHEIKKCFDCDSIAIYGSGNWGKKLFGALRQEKIYIKYWADLSADKIDTYQEGVRIVRPEELIGKVSGVIIAIRGIDDTILSIQDMFRQQHMECDTLAEIYNRIC